MRRRRRRRLYNKIKLEEKDMIRLREMVFVIINVIPNACPVLESQSKGLYCFALSVQQNAHISFKLKHT